MPPNILLLISDSQRVDTLGVVGKTPCRTPTWDRIANEGVLLDHLRSTGALCSPSRASIFTGLFPHQVGMPHSPYATLELKTEDAASREITRPPISHYLRQVGYQCFHAGVWGLGESNITRWVDRAAASDEDTGDYAAWCRSQGIPSGLVFDDPKRCALFRSPVPPHMSIPRPAVLEIPEDKELNRWILQNGITLLNERQPNRPWFAVISFYGPHPPFIVPEAYYNLYDPQTIPQPPNWQPSAGEPSFLATSYYRRLRHDWGDDFNAWRKSIAVYWGFVTYIDSLFAECLDWLDNSGLADQTLVTMISDHGEMLGQHGLWQKFCPYEEAIRVPWVMRWPGKNSSGGRVTMDVSHVDIAPTLLAAAGIDLEQLKLEGENLLPTIDGDRPMESARDCFSQYTLAPDFAGWHGVQNWRAIIRRPWKYVLHQNGERELFHLENDPFEVNNLAFADTQDIAQTLGETLLGWSRRIGDPFAAMVSSCPPATPAAAKASAR